MGLRLIHSVGSIAAAAVLYLVAPGCRDGCARCSRRFGGASAPMSVARKRARLEQSAARNWVLIDVVVQIAVRHEPRALSAPPALVWASLCHLSLAFAQTLDRGIADPPCLDASGLIPGRPGKPSTAYAYAIPVRSLVLHTTRMDRREPPITRIRSIDRS
jgi:hypothetical protein